MLMLVSEMRVELVMEMIMISLKVGRRPLEPYTQLRS